MDTAQAVGGAQANVTPLTEPVSCRDTGPMRLACWFKILQFLCERYAAWLVATDFMAHRCFGRRVAMREAAEVQPASKGVPGLSMSMTTGA
jgi:hypothetical protein